ncbi:MULTISPECIES: LPXTG cell wall anchor domain-containing protein [unclassified Enterococcus]|uniref:LPXTG cell wall anchor domain-containing protein n=1 Tax=unclassified Enterococcus TaxID=2608891 RepID=UPI0013EA989B|nr:MULTISPECIES: LPXTG cell wall anchor domain-containing protein [unclassified Enterococcus]
MKKAVLGLLFFLTSIVCLIPIDSAQAAKETSIPASGLFYSEDGTGSTTDPSTDPGTGSSTGPSTGTGSSSTETGSGTGTGSGSSGSGSGANGSKDRQNLPQTNSVMANPWLAGTGLLLTAGAIVLLYRNRSLGTKK